MYVTEKAAGELALLDVKPSRPTPEPEWKMLLKKVREILASGEVKHLKADMASIRVFHDPREIRKIKGHMFHMGSFCQSSEYKGNILSKPHCGTAMCIGGWMGLLKAEPEWKIRKDGQVNSPYHVGAAADRFLEENPKLRNLFFPKRTDWFPIGYGEITIPQAVFAIDMFLDGQGDNCWDHVRP